MTQQSNEDQIKLNIDVVSDIVCPWCYVGKKQLELALAKLPDIPLDIRWRPYQLNPQMPKEGMDRREYMEKKFGPGANTHNFYKRLEDVGQEVGIDFEFEKIEFAPNTLDAHRLIHWSTGGDDQASANDATNSNQHQMVTRLFEIYFEEGGNLGDQEVLVKAAKEIGMNDDLVRELLESDRDIDQIQEQVAIAGKMGISGVPCFIIENKYGISGAQPPAVLMDNFRKAYMEKLEEAQYQNAE